MCPTMEKWIFILHNYPKDIAEKLRKNCRVVRFTGTVSCAFFHICLFFPFFCLLTHQQTLWNTNWSLLTPFARVSTSPPDPYKLPMGWPQYFFFNICSKIKVELINKREKKGTNIHQKCIFRFKNIPSTRIDPSWPMRFFIIPSRVDLWKCCENTREKTDLAQMVRLNWRYRI